MIPIYVKLTKYQKERLAKAYQKKENINLKVQLSDDKNGDKIYVNKTQYNRIMKGKTTIINFNTSNYRSMKQDSSSILSSVLPTLTKVAAKAAPVLTKTVLPGLATGVASALVSLGIDSLFDGNGIDGKTMDIVKAMAVITNELNRLPKNQKEKFDQLMMMNGNGQTMKGGFLGTLLASIGIPLVVKMLGSGLHNTPAGAKGYKTHSKKIPSPPNSQPVVKQNEGTALIHKKWQPYNAPPFYDEYGIKGYGVKKTDQKRAKG